MKKSEERCLHTFELNMLNCRRVIQPQQAYNFSKWDKNEVKMGGNENRHSKSVFYWFQSKECKILHRFTF